MASDLENQESAAVAAPTTEEKPEKIESANGDAAEVRKALNRKTAEPESKAAGNKPEGGKPSEQGGPQQGGRKRHGGAQQAGQKNGTTLDLVELKDMSIQKLNQIAKDLGVGGTAGSA